MNPLLKKAPTRILLLKAHSAGIGDILRSSAAWRVLKDQWPGAELHLCFFTIEPGYPSEELIREHSLLSGFHVIDKRARNWGQWRRFWGEVNRVSDLVKPDLVIDFETNGIRLALVAGWVALRTDAKSVGISEFKGRGLVYSCSAPSRRQYAAEHGFSLPLEYTERDFVALAALGLQRNGTAIEMQESAKGAVMRERLFSSLGLNPAVPIVGVNIGCATPGAEGKRPDNEMLSELLAGLQKDHGFQIVLTGAKFEREVNQAFLRVHEKKGLPKVFDLAGETDISGLTGVIRASRLFISSDSGPYHMAVAMRVPTLCLFNFPTPPSYHVHPWVRCRIATSLNDVGGLRSDVEELRLVK